MVYDLEKSEDTFAFECCALDGQKWKVNDAKKRHLSDSNTRGQRPTAVIAGDPVNHSGKVTSSQS